MNQIIVRKTGIRKVIRIVWFSLVAIFLIWNWTTFQGRNLPADTFLDNDQVTVNEDKDQIVFKSFLTDHTIEVIFFQGGLADPEAYAPLCRKIAEHGYTCHLIKMAFRLPQRDYQKITNMFDLRNGQYIIGGHSQGGKMAAQFVYEHPTLMKGLFLMGTSHPRDIDLSEHSIPTLKLYAENDGLASVEEVMTNKSKLPKNTKLVLIKGANHSQFGYLGRLMTDDKADIPVAEQQQIVTNYLLNFLDEVKQGK